MPQKLFDDSDAIPLDDSDAIPFDDSDAQGGKWVKKGFTTQWVPDTPPTNEQGTKWIDPTPALKLVEQGGRNMRESSLGRAFPTLADIAATMMEFTNRSTIEGLAEPDVLATGLAGLLRPRPSMIPKENPIGAMESFKYEPGMGVRLRYPESSVEANSVNIGTSTITNRSIGSPPYAGDTRLGFEPYVKTTPVTEHTMIETHHPKNPNKILKIREVHPGDKIRANEELVIYEREGKTLPYPLNVVPQAVQPRSAQAVTEALTPTKLVPGAAPATNTPGNVISTGPMKFIRGGFQVTKDGTFVDDFGNVINPEIFKPVPTAEALKAGGPGEKIDWLRETYELSRGTTAAGDSSAPFRQGLGLIGTKNWFRAWIPMFRAYGGEEAAKAANKTITQLPHVSSGLAERARLTLTDINDISRREEILRSKLAERLPAGIGRFIRSTNRGYTIFLNDLRARTFNDWVDDAIAQGLDPYRDNTLAQNIADVVGDLTGRGRLKFSQWLPGGYSRTVDLEQHAKRLADVFFAPKLMASRMRMLNPSTYIMLDPFSRQKELRGLLRLGAWWLSVAGLMRYIRGDESVSTDPNSPDFGKIREGNARMDIAGGFQQYLVAISRFITGKYTSSATDKEMEFGSRYGADVRSDTAVRFATNKLHPTLKFAWDLMSASKNRPVYLMDRIMQMYMPMLATDLVKIAQEDPKLLPWMGTGAAVGMGTQIYEKGESEGTYIDPENDIIWEGGILLPD